MKSVAPGSTFDVAVRISLDPGWHTYWQNPGDAGIPPKIHWNLPSGWKAGDILWPIPKKLIAPEVVSYGYENEAFLLVRLTTPKNAKIGSKVSLGAKVDWLVCQDGCIPASAIVTTEVQIAPQGHANPAIAKRMAMAERGLPVKAKDGAFAASIDGSDITLSFNQSVAGSVTFYASETVVEPSAKQTLDSSGGHSTLHLKLSQFAPSSVPRLRGLLVSEIGATVTSETIDIPLKRRNL